MDKREQQTDYQIAVDRFYQQIIRKGYVGDNLTQGIAEEKYPDIERGFDANLDIESEIDLEPGR